VCKNRLNGRAAEVCLARAISGSKKIKQVKLQGVVEKCASSAIGKKHLNSAIPHLIEDFGESRNINGKDVLFFNPLEIPESIATDMILGLDQVVNYMGHLIGIDITINPEAIGKKLYKKEELANIYKDFELDHVVILLVSKPFTTEALEKTIKEIIKKGDSCQIISL
jgi:hypothetical protein